MELHTFIHLLIIRCFCSCDDIDAAFRWCLRKKQNKNTGWNWSDIIQHGGCKVLVAFRLKLPPSPCQTLVFPHILDGTRTQRSLQHEFLTSSEGLNSSRLSDDPFELHGGFLIDLIFKPDVWAPRCRPFWSQFWPAGTETNWTLCRYTKVWFCVTSAAPTSGAEGGLFWQHLVNKKGKNVTEQKRETTFCGFKNQNTTRSELSFTQTKVRAVGPGLEIHVQTTSVTQSASFVLPGVAGGRAVLGRSPFSSQQPENIRQAQHTSSI